MDKLNLPKMGERTWFETLVKALSALDGRFSHDEFNRDYVLSNGLSRPNGQGDLGVNHFKIGDLNIVFGWGDIHMNAQAYQSGTITLPYSGANYRATVGDAYTWDGTLKFTSTEGKIMITPQAAVNNTFLISFIMVWSDN